MQNNLFFAFALCNALGVNALGVNALGVNALGVNVRLLSFTCKYNRNSAQ
ncbi:hypothetical protein [Pseudoalteromonas holothuriae]|nr:hypothetical protein [Pseudoalteromonas sp. CIP111854]